MSKHVLLLVSPSPLIAAMIEASTVALDCTTRRVTSVHDALAYIGNYPAALAVVDQDLPDGSGIDLLAQMRDIAPLTERALIANPEMNVNVAIDALNRSKISLVLRKPLNDPRIIRKGLREALNAYRKRPHEQFNHRGIEAQTAAAPSDPHAQKLERLYTLGEISSNLIHQFNNILTIMNGHLELLVEDIEDPELIARAQTILQAGEDGARLTRSIQNFARRGPQKPEGFQVNSLICETLEMTEPIIRNRTTLSAQPVEIETDLRADAPVHGNPGEMREVLTNLILNATDAMPSGGRLTVRTWSEEDSTVIEVEDTGIGMSDTVRRRIFEPFFSTKGDKGNGLGLGIVRRIVREHDGDIRVHSRPGQGTRFTIALPRQTRPNFADPAERLVAFA